jgi:hypothetical protein
MGISASMAKKVPAIWKRSRRVRGRTPRPTAPPKLERLAEKPSKIRGMTHDGIRRV